jgi:hypothetical protein
MTPPFGLSRVLLGLNLPHGLNLTCYYNTHSNAASYEINHHAMKPLAEYDWHDWGRLRPITHLLKTLRYSAERELYVRRHPRADDISLQDHIRGRRVLITIAYNDLEAIEIQARLIAHFVARAQHIVADNSPDDQSAAAIRAFAARVSIPYVRLPNNPWSKRREQDSRSHGLALNWVWRNLLLPGEPEMFGLLDDDIFPTEPDDPFSVLEWQPVYGFVRGVGARWFLGAGFSFFRFRDVKQLPLDFGQDWFSGLDTGGANWDVLYRNLDRNRLQFTPTHFLPYKPGVDPAQAAIQWCGVWLHEVGHTRRAGFLQLAADKRRVIREMLAPHLGASAAQKSGAIAQEAP